MMEVQRILFSVLSVLLILPYVLTSPEIVEDDGPTSLFTIEGKVTLPGDADQAWHSNTRVLVDGGTYLGFLKNDGSFAIHNIPSGSFVVEVANPSHIYEPVRVDITQKGKMRARKVNNLIQSGPSVQTLPYPLKLKGRGMAAYFQVREEWRVTDMLKNPMVLMMVLPLIVIVILPKMMNMQDPETQKDMQQQMNMLNPANKPQMPDMSEMLANWLGGGGGTKAKPKAVKKKRAT